MLAGDELLGDEEATCEILGWFVDYSPSPAGQDEAVKVMVMYAEERPSVQCRQVPGLVMLSCLNGGIQLRVLRLENPRLGKTAGVAYLLPSAKSKPYACRLTLHVLHDCSTRKCNVSVGVTTARPEYTLFLARASRWCCVEYWTWIRTVCRHGMESCRNSKLRPRRELWNGGSTE